MMENVMKVRRTVRRPLRPAGVVRRDPRVERDMYTIGAGAPVALSPRGLPRRNPRDWRHTIHSNGLLRIDRSVPPQAIRPAFAAAPQVRAVEAAPKLREVAIPQPAFLIGVVPDLEDGKLTRQDLDLIGAGRVLADAQGESGRGAVLLIDFGVADAETLRTAGVDRVLSFRGEAYDGFAPDARAAAVWEVIDTLKLRHVLFQDTPTAGGDLGRRVAARLGELPASHVQKLSTEQVASRGDGGRHDFLRQPPRVLLVDEDVAEPVHGAIHEAQRLPDLELSPVNRVRDQGLAAVDPNAVPLKEADFIVSAGNGVTNWNDFHLVAQRLGAAEGGSRVVCDAGFLPRGRQVGASGTLVEPRCYVAFGIAGAPQHLQGITRCERVVAINTDLHAEMIKRADLAIVADAQKVMPALSQLMERVRNGN